MNEILKGKTAAFLGDSICMASTFDKEHQWWGWAGRIDRDYGFASYVNKGCDGASVSDCRKQNRVIFQLERIKDMNFDYLMLHGGVNDAWDSREVGKMTDSFAVEDFDNSVELTDEESIKKINVILDRLDEDEDVQKVYHNWDE